MSSSKVRRRVGRPLDLAATRRILSAALQVYSEHGLHGLTMTAICRQAKVGKALLYSRYKDVGTILFDAFARDVPQLEGPFESVRDLLIAEATRMANMYLSDIGLAVDRIQVDAALGYEPAVSIAKSLLDRTVLPMRAMIRNAINSGELPETTSVTMLLDTIEGAIRMHTTAAPHLLDKVRATLSEYIVTLVDQQLWLVNNYPANSK